MAMALLFGGFGCATEREHEGKAKTLEARARVSRAEAERIALGRVPGGSIKEGEIEKEKGKVFWSFDISTPGTRDISEVHVDAQSGEVLGVEKETAEKEAGEKKKEKRKEKEEDEKEEKK